MSSLLKQPFSDIDIEELKQKQKKNSKTNFIFVVVLILIFLINYFLFKDNIKNNVYQFIKIVDLLLFGLIILIVLYQNVYSLDLTDKTKYVGIVKIKNKIFIYDAEQPNEYKIKFDDWRIRTVNFHKEYWDLINENDEFYLEQAINSEYIFKLRRNDEDFIKGIIRI